MEMHVKLRKFNVHFMLQLRHKKEKRRRKRRRMKNVTLIKVCTQQISVHCVA